MICSHTYHLDSSLGLHNPIQGYTEDENVNNRTFYHVVLTFRHMEIDSALINWYAVAMTMITTHIDSNCNGSKDTQNLMGIIKILQKMHVSMNLLYNTVNLNIFVKKILCIKFCAKICWSLR